MKMRGTLCQVAESKASSFTLSVNHICNEQPANWGGVHVWPFQSGLGACRRTDSISIAGCISSNDLTLTKDLFYSTAVCLIPFLLATKCHRELGGGGES